MNTPFLNASSVTDMDEWPFDDPPDTAVLTSRDILEGKTPVLHVTHDSDDGGWQFMPGTSVSPEDARVVGLGRMVRSDDSLRDLADLPEGWRGWRDRPGTPWRRGPSDQ